MSDLKSEFDRCWPWIEGSLEFAAFHHNGKVHFTHHKEHVWARIEQQKCVFWPASDSVIITEFYVSPTGIKSHHNWIAGGELQQIKENMRAVEEFGRAEGAWRQVGHGRRGWLREFEGYREIGVRKEKPLV